jgi:tRNA A-37 threonylcarbamoyl transferase component Bud32
MEYTDGLNNSILLKRLEKLPINGGKYLVLPDLDRPQFIIPIDTHRLFRISLNLLKPKGSLGKIKKMLLSLIPIWVIKRKFDTIHLTAGSNELSSRELIMPWNQARSSKITVLKQVNDEIVVIKTGFGTAKCLVETENKVLKHLRDKYKSMVPKVISYIEVMEYSQLVMEYCEGAHPNKLPRKSCEFLRKLNHEEMSNVFVEHPHVIRIMESIERSEHLKQNRDLLQHIRKWVRRYAGSSLNVCLMHGDFTSTNIICQGVRETIIDWEDAVFDGAPIDSKYFLFRREIDQGKAWPIHDSVDLLVVLHFIYFELKYSGIEKFDIFWSDHAVEVIRRG